VGEQRAPPNRSQEERSDRPGNQQEKILAEKTEPSTCVGNRISDITERHHLDCKEWCYKVLLSIIPCFSQGCRFFEIIRPIISNSRATQKAIREQKMRAAGNIYAIGVKPSRHNTRWGH
jgi:hypothetical protein